MSKNILFDNGRELFVGLCSPGFPSLLLDHNQHSFGFGFRIWNPPNINCICWVSKEREDQYVSCIWLEKGLKGFKTRLVDIINLLFFIFLIHVWRSYGQQAAIITETQWRDTGWVTMELKNNVTMLSSSSADKKVNTGLRGEIWLYHLTILNF